MQTDTTADKRTFPAKFFNIGERSFEWVWANKKEFVEFTVNKMSQTTGLFKEWQTYCLNRQRDGTEKEPTGNEEKPTGKPRA